MAELPKTTTTPPDYNLVVSPAGYFAKREITNIEPNTLVKGSKNVMINDADKVETRKGYEIDGSAGTVKNGVYDSFDFISKKGKRIMRVFENNSGNGELKVRVVLQNGTVGWYTLKDNFIAGRMNFATFWDTTEVTRYCLMVDGSTNIHMWSGAVAYVASNTATTLTLSGTKTFAQNGFLVGTSGRGVTIPGYGTFTYTGGETTTTLTGLSALPAIPVGTPIFQSVLSYNSLTGIPAGAYDHIDFITTVNNHIVIGSTESSDIYGSKTTDFKDFSFTTPLRASSEGFKLTIDNFVTGFLFDNQGADISFVVFAREDEIYRVKFVLSADNAAESLDTKKLPVGNGQSVTAQSSIVPVKNGFMYLTTDKTLSWFTSIQNVFTPQSLPISDLVKEDFDALDMTNASGIFWGNAIWLAFPAENLVYVYDFDKALWQAPFTIPISRFSIIDNVLYGHSNSEDTTYKLNTTEKDNGVDIDFVVAFGYRQYGARAVYKQFSHYYNELYMKTESVVTVQHLFDFQGSKGILSKTMYGTDTQNRFALTNDSNLGKSNLGKNPLGSNTLLSSDLAKYRFIHQFNVKDFFEHQVIYTSNTPFQILAHGGWVINSRNLPTLITK
jgi:hypothetical protein